MITMLVLLILAFLRADAHTSPLVQDALPLLTVMTRTLAPMISVLVLDRVLLAVPPQLLVPNPIVVTPRTVIP
jgi:hypothetical protein